MVIYRQILDSLSKYISLSKSEEDYFISNLKCKSFRRKELILIEGQVCNCAYFINSGCVRPYYNINGEQNTAEFFFENGWYTDFSSFLTGNPSQQNIVAMEDTELLLISKLNLDLIYKQIPQFERFGRLIAEQAFLGLLRRNEMLLNLSAEQRYLKMLKERPKVFQRIPQHYIASYLGITPPSLSRIRRQISKQ